MLRRASSSTLFPYTTLFRSGDPVGGLITDSAGNLYGTTSNGGSAVRGCAVEIDRKSTRLNSSHSQISYAVFCLKKKKRKPNALRLVNPSTAKIKIFTASAL